MWFPACGGGCGKGTGALVREPRRPVIGTTGKQQGCEHTEGLVRHRRTPGNSASTPLKGPRAVARVLWKSIANITENCDMEREGHSGMAGIQPGVQLAIMQPVFRRNSSSS